MKTDALEKLLDDVYALIGSTTTDEISARIGEARLQLSALLEANREMREALLYAAGYLSGPGFQPKLVGRDFIATAMAPAVRVLEKLERPSPQKGTP